MPNTFPSILPFGMARLKKMPPLGFKRVSWFRRDLQSGDHAYVVVFTERGRRPYQKWIALSSSLQASAQREAFEIAQRYHLGTFDPWCSAPKDTALEAAAEAWMASGSHWSDATVRGRRGVLSLFLADYGHRSAGTITPDDILTFTSRPALRPASRASYLRVLKTFFRWCLKNRYLETDPTADITAPRQSKKRIAYFTRSELERFCEAARGYYQRRKTVIDKADRGNFIWIVDLVRFAVATGLRKGELRHLRWGDIEMEPGRIYVRSHQGFQTKVGSDRTLPIFPMAMDVLRHRQARRRSENPDELVFLGPSGRRLGESQINRAFRIARAEANLSEALDVHACRHTFASWLLGSGESLYAVSRWLGHSRISITADIYGHLQQTESEAGQRIFSEGPALVQ